MNYECTINGIHFDVQNFAQSCEKLIGKFPEFWINPIISFMEDWYSESKYVTINTSGSTTGKPKEIQLSKSMMTASAQSTCHFFDLRSHDKVLLALSADYIAGKMMLVRALVQNLHLIAVAPDKIPEINEKEKFRFTALVPYQFEALSKNPEKLKSIHTILLGGGGISEKQEAAFSTIHKRVFHSFGMSETASHVALRRVGVPDKIYYAIKGVHFSTDENNCLCVHWPLADEQHLQTRDVVELLSENSFKWIGRFDSMINSGGIKIFPEELETKIQSCIPCRFYISSEKSETMGEQCVLVLESGKEMIDEKKLLEEISSRLSKYEKPRKIYFFEKLDETATGKVIRSRF